MRPIKWVNVGMDPCAISLRQTELAFKRNSSLLDVLYLILEHVRQRFVYFWELAKSDVTGPWFDHDAKTERENRPLFRHPEALALGPYTIPRPLVEGLIMICELPSKIKLIRTVKVLTNLMRFLAAVAFARYSQYPYYYIPLGVLAIFFGVTEALINFWKEIAARVHKPGVPTYHTHPHHRKWRAHRIWHGEKI